MDINNWLLGITAATVIGFLAIVESTTPEYKLMVDGSHIDTYPSLGMCYDAAEAAGFPAECVIVE